MNAGRWLALAAAALLAACGHGKGGDEADKHGRELVILASPEVHNLEFLAPQMEKVTGAHIRFDYAGTVEMADRLRAGVVADFAWPADGLYIAFNAPGRVLSAENIARSPVVLGLKKPRAEELGWDRKAPSWEEIAKAAAKEDLALGMADPVASNLGLAALLSAVLATSHGSYPHAHAQAPALNVPVLKSLYASMKLLGGSGTWLAESYVKQEDRLDGMINYESAVLELNAGTDLDTPLAVIHPRDGVMVADHPLLLLNAAKRPAYDKLTALLRSPAVQREIMDKTWRRPVNPEVKPGPLFGQHLPRSLPESLGLEFVRDVLDAYQGQIRPPAHTYFVIDVSGSMAEEHRMDELKGALGVLAGSDQGTLAGRYARFQPRERVNLVTFSSVIVQQQALDFGGPQGYAPAMQTYQDFVAGLEPKGGTALYDALRTVYEQAAKDHRQEPGYYSSIVLLSDGQNSSGSDYAAFEKWYDDLPDTAQDIPIYPVLFGEPNLDEMKQLAELTGGRVIDASESSLSEALKYVRGYQ
jgi:Ca-activated chloride channel homolog